MPAAETNLQQPRNFIKKPQFKKMARIVRTIRVPSTVDDEAEEADEVEGEEEQEEEQEDEEDEWPSDSYSYSDSDAEDSNRPSTPVEMVNFLDEERVVKTATEIANWKAYYNREDRSTMEYYLRSELNDGEEVRRIHAFLDTLVTLALEKDEPKKVESLYNICYRWVKVSWKVLPEKMCLNYRVERKPVPGLVASLRADAVAAVASSPADAVAAAASSSSAAAAAAAAAAASQEGVVDSGADASQLESAVSEKGNNSPGEDELKVSLLYQKMV